MGISSITDKVVVITGASSGVGENTAPMAALKVEEWDRMIDVNIRGLEWPKGTEEQFSRC